MSERPFTLEALTRARASVNPAIHMRLVRVSVFAEAALHPPCPQFLPLRLPREALNTGACPLHYGMSHVRLPARILKATLAMA